MTDERRRERDLILAPNEYAFIRDETKGNIINYVGPHKTSLANTDQPTYFDEKTKRFISCTLEEAIKGFFVAPEGWYLVLKNPAEGNKFPKTGTANSLLELDVGKKINIPGPIAFTPWPGQMVKIIQGHHLRSNQYLLLRIYDETAAKENWEKAVIKLQTTKGDDSQEAENKLALETVDLTVGKQMVIKGTEVSFYMPPTGMEVVADEHHNYIREAITLERLEYCILLDENGNKRYIKGPDVVFPKPTETFVTENNSRKFKAIELNEISGIYLKVIAPYTENKKEYKVGDEIFLTGKEQMIYFPRAEHAVIKYGGKAINYAVAIPAGEARYVLNRLTGQISLKKGPSMFLPDPRKEVIVKRVLDSKQVALWFPGNQKALEYNKELMETIDDESISRLRQAPSAPKMEKAKESFIGDSFQRGTEYSPPRTITLDTKYEGAVAIGVWTGYAILVISNTGERKVVVGPQTYLLEYDEILGTVTLSTGNPKTDARTIKTVYLGTLYNKISDTIIAETKDLCGVSIQVSYRVNFEGDSKKWFDVENYVKFLTDHMRSILRFAVREHGIEDFYMNAITIIRDTILGKSENGKRKGRLFEENGMRVYDVEVLGLDIGDGNISDLLIEAQQKSVEQTLEITTSRKELETIKEKEKLKQLIAKSKYETELLMLDLKIEESKKKSLLELEELNSKNKVSKDHFDFKVKEQDYLNKISTAEISRFKSKKELELSLIDKELAQKIEYLRAEVDAIVNKSKAISPQFISALQSFSDKALAEKMAESMSPLAILGGKSVTDVLTQLLRGTTIEKVLNRTLEEN
jgi:major vault protein